jgi:hypothetical protein
MANGRPGEGAGLRSRRCGENAVLILISCPDCQVPAEVTDRFWLPSTDGEIAHVTVECAAGHHFRMAVDGLPASAQEIVTVPELACECRDSRAQEP